MLEREQTTIRLPAELKERIQLEADSEGQSFNHKIVQLIQYAFEQE